MGFREREQRLIGWWTKRNQSGKGSQLCVLVPCLCCGKSNVRKEGFILTLSLKVLLHD